MKMITPDKSIIKGYDFRRECDFLFEHCFIGDLYKEWTDYLLDNEIPMTVSYDEHSSDFVKESGYSPKIIHMRYSDEDSGVYKMAWNHDDVNPDVEPVPKSDNFKDIFAEIFCEEGWKHECYYHEFETRWGHNEYKEGYSKNIGDIKLNTKSWVEYLTFQGYRTIVQFNLFEYMKKVRREEQINSLLN